MKFLSKSSFDKHLQAAFPNHVSLSFLIAIPSDYERRYVMHQLVKLLRQKDPLLRKVVFSDASHIWQEIESELSTISIWGGSPLVVCDHLEKLLATSSISPTETLTTLKRTSGFLILGTPSFKEISDFYQVWKQEIVVLDLEGEKPWEREQRLRSWITEKIEGKRIQGEALSHLIQYDDFSLIEQELDKLLCFKAEQEEITLSDAIAICSKNMPSNNWKSAEELVWGVEGFIQIDDFSTSTALSLLGQIRYHLQLGYQIAEILATRGKTSLAALHTQFPHLKPGQIERYVHQVTQRNRTFYEDGLNAAYKLEWMIKSSSLNIGLLFDHFQFKLRLMTLPKSP